jgi:hypothetical protein
MSLGVNQNHFPITQLLLNTTGFTDKFRAAYVDCPVTVDPAPAELLPWRQPECSQCSFPVELAKAQAEKAYGREMHQKAISGLRNG